uniref:U18-Theriditoxin-Lha1d_1 n=1 Tax=Latrodectus hasselti TaxID=256736 RepID=A0A482ZB35_LATHA
MKSILFTIALMCLLIAIHGAKLIYESELLEEGREECAKENESCSKMGMGSGPTECCAPKDALASYLQDYAIASLTSVTYL